MRLLLAQVGRGGDGQAIRDEILNIMHRNNISEKKGTWMEEWHQKLHNNTTPDDVPICEAYLAFLRADGDNGAYWRVLSDAGAAALRNGSVSRPSATSCITRLVAVSVLRRAMPVMPKNSYDLIWWSVSSQLDDSLTAIMPAHTKSERCCNSALWASRFPTTWLDRRHQFEHPCIKRIVAAGVTRERLENFDRPICQEPEHFADRKDALIGDFERYLGILKAVHSGADLQNAAKEAGGRLPGAAKGHLGYVLASRGSSQVRCDRCGGHVVCPMPWGTWVTCLHCGVHCRCTVPACRAESRVCAQRAP